ncbi:hypothetical protein SLS59_007287 [Nothophoma quercina]|uniref:Uncharacterized protein n=1 Tax=Nothophoma quercina TaxID=749835 RepID=A0ABR3QZJ6_9PLEO
MQTWSVEGRIAHNPLPAHLPFTRFSDDDVTAYFKANIEERMRTDSPAVEKLTDFYDFQLFEHEVSTYDEIKFMSPDKTGVLPITRIGLGPNTTYMTDVSLLTLQLHKGSMKISLDWRSLFTSISREEHRIATMKAAQLITSPSMFRLPAQRPTIVSPGNSSLEFAILLQLRRQRNQHLKPAPEAEKLAGGKPSDELLMFDIIL